MSADDISLKLVIMLTIGFSLATLLGYLAQKVKLSPILGYLLSGYLIGPFSPGYRADMALSEQLAEIGIILMMFGVGLHFKWTDLSKVKKIAVPGAIGQTLIATIAVAFFVHLRGWSIEQGIILGLAIGVASTVILVRFLTDHHLVNKQEGHIAMGWLLVEDLITVIALLLIPTLAASLDGRDLSWKDLLISFMIILAKFLVLITLLFTIGRYIIRKIFAKIVHTKSSELFIMTILAITFLIAMSATLFGLSIIMGSFMAGMIVGQTDIRRQVSHSTIPIKDVFAVIFFLSIGMLFDPTILRNQISLFLTILAIILLLKPLTAYGITVLFRYPFSIAATVAVSLAQIGEFSFILIEEANRYDLLPKDAYAIIVACAFVSISLNASIFNFLKSKKVIFPSV